MKPLQHAAAPTGGVTMCLGSDCDNSGVDRRAFLTGGAAVLAGRAATSHSGADDDKKPPPTRVLDDPAIRHGKVTFKNGDKEIDGYLARQRPRGSTPPSWSSRGT